MSRRTGCTSSSENEEHACRPYREAVLFLLLVLPLLIACKGKEPMTGVGITGIDHLPDHESVQDFSVDGYNAAQAGKGGSNVCCAMLPDRWRPDLTVEIRWNVTNWRDCGWEHFVRRVSVQRYDEPGRLWVHFMADGSIRVVPSGIGPGNPVYPGPHDAIPQKEPWKKYPWEPRCAGKVSLDPAMQ